jgi:hypothetical protein
MTYLFSRLTSGQAGLFVDCSPLIASLSHADLNKGSLSSRLPAPTYSQVRCTDVRRVVTNLI